MKKVIMILLGVGIMLLIIGNVAMNRYNEGREIASYKVELVNEKDINKLEKDTKNYLESKRVFGEVVTIHIYKKDEVKVLSILKNKSYVETVEP